MQTESLSHEHGIDVAAPDRRIGAFEGRYGTGTHDRLLRLLAKPCVTFAEIAERFHVTRERVRQWQMQWGPDAPRGRERRRRCLEQRRRQRLLEDPLFRAFYRHVRPHLSSGQLALVPARAGFRKRLVRVGDRLIFLKHARPCRTAHRPDARTYALTTYRGAAGVVYFRLSDTDFLLVPAGELPPAGTTFVDTPASKYQRYRNSLAALGIDAPAGRSADAKVNHAS